jgi:hypothetical protein
MRKNVFLIFSLAILLIVFGTIFGVVQQFLRMGANDPQIQLAEDTAAALNHGTPPGQLIAGAVDMQRSLAPFVIIYDKNGKVAAGNGQLSGKIAKAPVGVLRAADGKEYNAVTWQPQSGVRIASVSVAANNYYVLSGRSLKEVEKRENKAMEMAMTGGILAGAANFYGWYIVNRKAAATPAKSAPRP